MWRVQGAESLPTGPGAWPQPVAPFARAPRGRRGAGAGAEALSGIAVAGCAGGPLRLRFGVAAVTGRLSAGCHGGFERLTTGRGCQWAYQYVFERCIFSLYVVSFWEKGILRGSTACHKEQSGARDCIQKPLFTEMT